jgi:hypothetical protein
VKPRTLTGRFTLVMVVAAISTALLAGAVGYVLASQRVART